jgi:hypothetical protein
MKEMAYSFARDLNHGEELFQSCDALTGEGIMTRKGRDIYNCVGIISKSVIRAPSEE